MTFLPILWVISLKNPWGEGKFPREFVVCVFQCCPSSFKICNLYSSFDRGSLLTNLSLDQPSTKKYTWALYVMLYMLVATLKIKKKQVKLFLNVLFNIFKILVFQQVIEILRYFFKLNFEIWYVYYTFSTCYLSLNSQ